MKYFAKLKVFITNVLVFKDRFKFETTIHPLKAIKISCLFRLVTIDLKRSKSKKKEWTIKSEKNVNKVFVLFDKIFTWKKWQLCSSSRLK